MNRFIVITGLSGAGLSTAADDAPGPGLVRHRQPSPDADSRVWPSCRPRSRRRSPTWCSSPASGRTTGTCCPVSKRSAPAATTCASCSSRRPRPRSCGDSRTPVAGTRCSVRPWSRPSIASGSCSTPVRAEADVVLDTSHYNIHQLKARIRDEFGHERDVSGDAAVDPLVRLSQGSPAGRRPGLRLSVDGQPALRPRSAAAHRCRRRGPGGRVRLRWRRGVRRPHRRSAAHSPSPATRPRERRISRWRSGAPAVAIGRSPWRSRWPPDSSNWAMNHVSSTATPRCEHIARNDPHRFAAPRLWTRSRSARIDPLDQEATTEMTVRVGINGFGRIGRNFFRADCAADHGRRAGQVRLPSASRAKTSRSWPSTTSARSRPWPTCSSTTRCTASSTPTSRSLDDGISVDGIELTVLRGAQSRGSALGRSRRRRRDRVDRHLHQARQGRRPPRGRRAAGHRLGPVPATPTPPSWSVSTTTTFDPEHPQGHLQRLVHDQLLRARWSRCSTTPSVSRRAS